MFPHIITTNRIHPYHDTEDTKVELKETHGFYIQNVPLMSAKLKGLNQVSSG